MINNFENFKKTLEDDPELRKLINKKLMNASIDKLIAIAASQDFIISQEDLENSIKPAVDKQINSSTCIFVTQILIA